MYRGNPLTWINKEGNTGLRIRGYTQNWAVQKTKNRRDLPNKVNPLLDTNENEIFNLFRSSTKQKSCDWVIDYMKKHPRG